MTPDKFIGLCLESVGRSSFLSPQDIFKITGRSASAVCNDKRKGLIKPLSNKAMKPKFDGLEVYGYLVRIGQIEIEI